MPFNSVSRFVETVAFWIHASIAGIFHGLGVNDNQGRPLRFFLTCSRTCSCSVCFTRLEHASCPLLFVVPIDGWVGGKVFGQVLPVTSILQLIENAIKNFSLCPIGRSCPLLFRYYLEKQGFKDFPLFIGQVAGIRHEDWIQEVWVP